MAMSHISKIIIDYIKEVDDIERIFRIAAIRKAVKEAKLPIPKRAYIEYTLKMYT